MDIFITIIAILALILLWIIIYDSNRFIVVSNKFTDKKIKKPYKAAVIADLHNKCFGHDNEALLQTIYDQNPDCILIAGDVATAKKGKKNKNAIALLQGLAKKYPIYYGNGNHEQRMNLYYKIYKDMGVEYEKAVREMGIHLLINEKAILEEAGISIYGSQIGHEYYKRFKGKEIGTEYLESILGKPQEDCYNVLLAHNPEFFVDYANWGADLVLSGHVHGGIARIPFWGKGVISPKLKLFPKDDGGVSTQGNTTMLISRGLGTHTIPVRVFNPGELHIVDFLPSEE